MERLPLRRIAAFGFIPALAAIAPVIAIPVIVTQLGAHGWSALAIGQSVGGIAAVVVQFAWPTLGPAAIAGGVPATRWHEFARSLRVRLALFALIAAPAWFVAAALSPGPYASAAGLSAIAFSTYGLTPSWYFVGTGRASGVAAYETLPRLITTLLAIAILAVTASPYIYPICVLVGAAFGLAGAWIRIRKGTTAGGDAQPWPRASLMPHASLTLSGLVTSGYSIGSTAIVASVATSVPVVAAFAAVFRIQYLSRTPAMTLTTALQGWVAEGQAKHKRMKTALVTMAFLGVAVGLGISLVLGPVLRILFPGTSAVTPLTSVFCGLAVFAHAISSSTSAHVLIPSGRAHLVSVSTGIAGCLGVPLLLILTPLYGVDGAMAALLAAEALVVVVQLPAALGVVSHPDVALSDANVT